MGRTSGRISTNQCKFLFFCNLLQGFCMGFLEITLAFFSRAKSKQSPGSGSGEKLSAHSLRIPKKAPGSQVLLGFQRFRRFCKKHHSKLRILCKIPHGRCSRSTSGSCAGTERRAHSGAYRKKRSHLQKGFCTWPCIHMYMRHRCRRKPKNKEMTYIYIYVRRTWWRRPVGKSLETTYT